MQQQRLVGGPVGLIARADSPLADKVAADLAAADFLIARHEPGEPLPAGAVGAVMLVEHEGAIDSLAATLSVIEVPTLVLAATPEMVARALPVLDARRDLVSVSDGTGMIIWRLARLIELSKLLAAGQTQLDALTGLCNRRAFETHLEEIAASRAAGTTVGLLSLNLDRFKAINGYGHVAGDTLVRAVADRLSRVLAPGDVLGRLGGDEFACILPRPDIRSLTEVPERLLREIAGVKVPWPSAASGVMSVTASAGLTLIRPGATTRILMNEADVALYEAKNAGRNRVVVYVPPDDAGARVSADLRLRHFESATRLASERLAEMIALNSRRLIEMAKQEACVCHLTGLHNRGHFDPALMHEIECAHGQARPLSLALIDVDQFGNINKTHGWPTGDRVLQAFAAVARANVRSTDWVARYAGDEFVIVMPDTSLDSAVHVVERVRQAFASAHIDRVGGGDVSATVSIGVAQLPDGASTTVDFVNQASDQLRAAKSLGRNRVVAAATC